MNRLRVVHESANRVTECVRTWAGEQRPLPVPPGRLNQEPESDQMRTPPVSQI